MELKVQKYLLTNVLHKQNTLIVLGNSGDYCSWCSFLSGYWVQWPHFCLRSIVSCEQFPKRWCLTQKAEILHTILINQVIFLKKGQCTYIIKTAFFEKKNMPYICLYDFISILILLRRKLQIRMAYFNNNVLILNRAQ